MVKRAAPIAGTARNTVHDFLFTETLVEAITSDPGFNKGFYASSADVREGLLRHAKMWAVMGWSTEFFQENRHKALGFSSMDDFIINFMNGYFSVMDPNDLLCMAWKWQRGDVSRHTGGDLRAALGRIKAKTFVMPMSSDMFFPPADCQAEWRLIPDAEFRPIQTIDGHLALFGADPNAIGQLDKHLERVARDQSVVRRLPRCPSPTPRPHPDRPSRSARSAETEAGPMRISQDWINALEPDDRNLRRRAAGRLRDTAAGNAGAGEDPGDQRLPRQPEAAAGRHPHQATRPTRRRRSTCRPAAPSTWPPRSPNCARRTRTTSSSPPAT